MAGQVLDFVQRHSLTGEIRDASHPTGVVSQMRRKPGNGGGDLAYDQLHSQLFQEEGGVKPGCECVRSPIATYSCCWFCS